MKFSADTARRTAAASLAAAALLGVTGCSFSNLPATTLEYAASNGTSAELNETKFRNIAFISSEEGGPARLIGTLSNTSLEDVEVEIATPTQAFEVTVPSREAVSLEHDEMFVVDSFQGMPGEMYEIAISVEDDVAVMNAAVFDGVLPAYRDLVPGGYDESVTDHLEHGPDTYGAGTSYHGSEESGH